MPVPHILRTAYDLANEMPLELVCIIAHQADTEITPTQTLLLLDLFPDEHYSAMKETILQDPSGMQFFADAMMRRLDHARQNINYIGDAHEITLQVGDQIWKYGGRVSVFPALDEKNTARMQRRIKAIISSAGAGLR